MLKMRHSQVWLIVSKRQEVGIADISRES